MLNLLSMECKPSNFQEDEIEEQGLYALKEVAEWKPI